MSKWLLLPEDIAHQLVSVVKRPPTYRAALDFVKSIDRQLSLHSLRRGALTALASLGYSMHEVGHVSLHTPKSDEYLSVRRYVAPHPAQPEIQQILEMTSKLFALTGC